MYVILVYGKNTKGNPKRLSSMEFNRKEYDKKYSRERMKRNYSRYRSAGGCGRCGEPCAPFALCKKHRLYQSKISKIYYQKHKANILEREKARIRNKRLRERNEQNKAHS